MAIVDIITPTYRRASVLPEFLAALAAQTYQDFRLILVNDDPSHSLVDLLAGWQKRLNLLLLEPGINQRAAAARNLGLAHATAPYIALCDDDDLWLPMHLEKTVGILESDAADFVYAASDLVETWRTSTGRQQGMRRRFAFAPDLDFLRCWNSITLSGEVYRRELHDQLGNFDTQIAHYADWDWHLRVAQSGARMQLSATTTVEIVIDRAGDNLSGDPLNMASELPLLIQKHALGPLPSANFWTMLDRPEVQARLIPA